MRAPPPALKPFAQGSSAPAHAELAGARARLAAASFANSSRAVLNVVSNGGDQCGQVRAAAPSSARASAHPRLFFSSANRRIELGENLAFWHQLAAQGPIVFDEFHHKAGEGTPISAGVLVIIAQLIACFVLFAFVRGARLGPARPELPVRHRSMLEYLSSFAWLTRKAGVEKELLAELRARFRVLLQERLGVEISHSEEEAAREVERQCRLPAADYLRTVEEVAALQASPHVTPRQFAKAARAYARLERIVTGRSV